MGKLEPIQAQGGITNRRKKLVKDSKTFSSTLVIIEREGELHKTWEGGK